MLAEPGLSYDWPYRTPSPEVCLNQNDTDWCAPITTGDTGNATRVLVPLNVVAVAGEPVSGPVCGVPMPV